MLLHLDKGSLTEEWQVFVAQFDAFQLSIYKGPKPTEQPRQKHYGVLLYKFQDVFVQNKHIHSFIKSIANLGSAFHRRVEV